MTDKDKSLSGQESLDIIHRMISQARGSIKASAFHILLWGWIVAAGSLGHFLLLKYSDIAHPEWAWGVILIGIAGSVIRGMRSRRQKGASTYTGKLMSMIWITFLINYFILVFFIAKINFYITPVVLVLTAGSVFLSGSILKYNPIKWGLYLSGRAAFSLFWSPCTISFLQPLQPWSSVI